MGVADNPPLPGGRRARSPRRRLAPAVAAAVTLVALAVQLPLRSDAAFIGQTFNSANTVSSAMGELYLKTDGPGDRTSTPVLALSKTVPGVATLPNYDTDRDAFAGLVVQEGGAGPNETDPLKHQTWSFTATSPIVLNPGVTLTLWSSSKDFEPAKAGTINAYLRDCTTAGTGCTTVASATVTDATWNDGVGDFAEDTFDFGAPNHTVPTGRALQIKIEIDPTSDSYMWLAYDTIGYPSRLTIGVW